MKRRSILLIVLLAVLILFCAGRGIDLLITELTEATNLVCRGQKFSSAEDAIVSMEAASRELIDPSLDYCPPYSLKYTLEYGDNTIIFFDYCEEYDGEKARDYAVRILKHNRDGTLSFDTGFADFVLETPTEGEDYYYFTNIDTKIGSRSISFLYLPKGSDQVIYIDGKETAKELVQIDGQTFYICYAISHRDTFFTNLVTPIHKRHTIEIK